MVERDRVGSTTGADHESHAPRRTDAGVARASSAAVARRAPQPGERRAAGRASGCPRRHPARPDLAAPARSLGRVAGGACDGSTFAQLGSEGGQGDRDLGCGPRRLRHESRARRFPHRRHAAGCECACDCRFSPSAKRGGYGVALASTADRSSSALPKSARTRISARSYALPVSSISARSLCSWEHRLHTRRS